MNELVNPHHTVLFGECNDFCAYLRGFDVAYMRQLWVLMSPWSEKMNFVSLKLVKDSIGILFVFGKNVFARYGMHGTTAICMGIDLRFYGRYCVVRMVVSRYVCQLYAYCPCLWSDAQNFPELHDHFESYWIIKNGIFRAILYRLHETVRKYYNTSIIPTLRSEFLGLENTSYRQQLRAL